jgi:uncharacterized SAM-binding protein YcdF (DUF218 family)
MRTLKKIIFISIMVAIILAAGMVYAPRYLAYSTNYARADAVIVLLGPVFNDRERYARDLIQKGMADYLIIPAYHKTYRVDQGKLKPLSDKADKNNMKGNIDPAARPYYEDTHLELIAAKKTMKMYGQKSAIFVSAPYHMRRIQLMVDKEFDNQSQYYFSPTPYEAAPLNVWELKASDWKKVRRECVKILWFMIYYPWTKSGAS